MSSLPNYAMAVIEDGKLVEYALSPVKGKTSGLIERVRPSQVQQKIHSRFRANLLDQFWPILQAELADLHDCAEWAISNSAFLFHLWRACDALASLLFASNERYNPASKRIEVELARLPLLPHNFINRYEKLLEGPFTSAGRRSTVQALTTLSAELAQ